MLATLEAPVADAAHRSHRSPASHGSAPHRRDLVGLQRSAGNRAVAAMLGHGGHATRGGSAAPGRQPQGSTSAQSEDEEGPVGQHLPQGNGDGPTTTTGGGDGGAPTPTPTPAPTGPTPATPPPLTLTSATVKAAPGGGAATRTDVGVGEVVTFTGSAAGTWTATTGTTPPTTAATTFSWTAPATAGSSTITITAGTQTASLTMTVHAPESISMRKVGSHASLLGPGGACMLTEVTFNPTTVCLGAIQWLEVPGPATSVSGFFAQPRFTAALLHHNPNASYAIVNDRNIMEAGTNNGPNDHCAWHRINGPYPPGGAFTWVVPNKYILDGEAAAAGRWFTDTNQVFTMSAAGVLTITKAGAST